MGRGWLRARHELPQQPQRGEVRRRHRQRRRRGTPELAPQHVRRDIQVRAGRRPAGQVTESNVSRSKARHRPMTTLDAVLAIPVDHSGNDRLQVRAHRERQVVAGTSAFTASRSSRRRSGVSRSSRRSIEAVRALTEIDDAPECGIAHPRPRGWAGVVAGRASGTCDTDACRTGRRGTRTPRRTRDSS